MLDIFLRLYRYRIVGANSTLAASAIYIIGVRLVEQFDTLLGIPQNDIMRI